MTGADFAAIVADAVRDALAPVVDRLTTLEVKAGYADDAILAIANSQRAAYDAAASIVERLAIVETKNGQPGPPGKDGRDGFDLKDFGVTLDADGRTLRFAFATTDLTKAIDVVAPWPVDRGPWRDGATYDAGDVVSYDGSAWTAREATGARPGDGATGWRLMIKRPRDGARARP